MTVTATTMLTPVERAVLEMLSRAETLHDLQFALVERGHTIESVRSAVGFLRRLRLIAPCECTSHFERTQLGDRVHGFLQRGLEQRVELHVA